MPLLVKYSCGCIGFPPHEEIVMPENTPLSNDRVAVAFIIQPCDGDPELQCTPRQVVLDLHSSKTEPRTSRYLTLEECTNVLQSVSCLLNDGYRYRELRNILGLSAEHNQ